MSNSEPATAAALRDRLAGLTPRQRLLLRQRAGGLAPAPSTHQVSTAQFGIWLFEQLRPGTPSYHNPAVVHLRGDLDVGALRRALRAVQARHQPLRSRYVEDDDGDVRAVVSTADAEPIDLRVRDVSTQPDPEAAAVRLAETEYLTPFDLAAGPVWRALLVSRTERHHLLAVTMHHIVSDGSSLAVLFAELAGAYRAARSGLAIDLPPLASSYFPLVASREHGPGAQAADRALRYWRTRLDGMPDGVPLEHLATAPADGGLAGRALAYHLPLELTEGFERACRANGASLFAGLAALLAMVLFGERGQRDIPLISPVDGRGVEGAGLIGCFVNNVVLRMTVDPLWTLAELLAAAGRTVTDALTHHRAPFGRVVAALGPSRSDPNRPFGNVAVVHNNAPSGSAEFAGLRMDRHEVPVAAVRHDWALHVARTPDGVRGNLEHSTRFPAGTMRLVLDRLAWLAGRAAAGDPTRLGELVSRDPGPLHPLRPTRPLAALSRSPSTSSTSGSPPPCQGPRGSTAESKGPESRDTGGGR